MSSTPAASEVGASPVSGDPRRWFVLVFVLLGQFMVSSSAGSLNIALASIRDDLDAADSMIQWVLVVYQLSYALTLVTGGRLGDLFGRRRIFVIGLSGFLASCVVAACAPTAGVLVAARVVQGVSGGLVSPQILAMIQVTFVGPERRTAFASFAVVSGGGFMMGGVLSGVLLELDVFGTGWRGTYLFSIVVSTVALVGALAVLPNPPRPADPKALDMRGVVLLTGGALLVLYPLIQGRNAGWPPAFAVMAVCAVPVLWVFLRHEQRVIARGGSPLMELALFRLPSFSWGIAVICLHSSVSFTEFFVITLSLQGGAGLDPLQTALATFPTPLGVMTTSFLSRRFAPRLGTRVFAVSGLLNAVSVVLVALVFNRAPAGREAWYIVGPMLLMGVAQGMTFSSMFHLALRDVSEDSAGSASGILQTVQQSMSAVGVALVGLVFFGVLGAGAVDDYDDALTASLLVIAALGVGLFLLHFRVRAVEVGRTRS